MRIPADNHITLQDYNNIILLSLHGVFILTIVLLIPFTEITIYMSKYLNYYCTTYYIKRFYGSTNRNIIQSQTRAN